MIYILTSNPSCDFFFWCSHYDIVYYWKLNIVIDTQFCNPCWVVSSDSSAIFIIDTSRIEFWGCNLFHIVICQCSWKLYLEEAERWGWEVLVLYFVPKVWCLQSRNPKACGLNLKTCKGNLVTSNEWWHGNDGLVIKDDGLQDHIFTMEMWVCYNRDTICVLAQ